MMKSPSIKSPNTLEELIQTVQTAYSAGTRLRVVGGSSLTIFEPSSDRTARHVSTQKLNTFKVVPRDYVAYVDAGVDPTALETALKPSGLVWPLHRIEAPQTIGGMIASGRATTIDPLDVPARRWILGARVVDGTGKLLAVGGSTVKNSVGYGLTHALWGSRGHLGAITQLTLRLRNRREGDKTAMGSIDASTLQMAVALVCCDDLTSHDATLALNNLPHAYKTATSDDETRVVALYNDRDQAEFDANALCARGVEARVDPPRHTPTDSVLVQASRSAIDPAGVFA